MTPGYYYWDGSRWLRFETSSKGSARVAAAGGGQAVPAYLLSEIQSLTTTADHILLVEPGREGLFRYVSGDTSPNDSAMVLVPSSGKRYKRVFSGPIDVRWFGAKGDNATDDTQAIQAAVNAAATAQAIVYFPMGVYKTTSQILLRRDIRGIDMANSSYIRPVGSGYTALMTEESFVWAVCKIQIFGDPDNRPAVNGIQLNNPQRSVINWIGVFNLDGFGMKVVNGWDCTYLTITTENCGNSNNYAFSIIGDNETSNMTHVLRLQVELAHERAIFCSGNNLSITIDNIHSEKAYATSSGNVWVLGGGSCTYNNVRLNALDTDGSSSSNAICLLQGAANTGNDFRVEGNIKVVADANGGGSPITLNQTSIAGQLASTGTGPLWVNNSSITKVTGVAVKTKFNNCVIGTVETGFAGAWENRQIFIDSEIGSLTSISGESKLELINTVVNNANDLGNARTKLFNSKISAPNGVGVNYRSLELYGSEIIGNVTTDVGYLGLYSNSKITGNLTIGTNRQVIFDLSSTLTGTLTNMSYPESAAYYGSWEEGKITRNPKTFEVWQYNNSSWQPINTFLSQLTKAGSPTTGDIPSGFSRIVVNTADNTIKLYTNHGGSLFSVLLN
ncbi:hypothetical protein GCM10028806_16260 [Spirosoma terrae]